MPPLARPSFGTSTVTYDYATYLKWVRAADDLGYDFAGHGDSQLLWADVHVSLAAAAMITSHIRLATMVTNGRTRHPSVAAGAALSLQKLSHGRAILGLGSGDSAVHTIGGRPTNMEELESYARVVRRLLAGEDAEWEGGTMRMRWPPEPVPIWIAAEGPQMLYLAGRIADGVVVGWGVGPGVVEDAVSRIHAGARDAGRNPNEIEIWWKLNACLADSEEVGWRKMAWSLASLANHVFRHSLAEKRVPAELEPGLRALHREYAFHSHAVADEHSHNAALVERYGLTEWLGARFVLAGPPERIVERIDELAVRGASNLLIGQFGRDPVADLIEFHDQVVTRYR